MKLSVEYLKQESCNFDLECIFSLDLSKKGIKDLDRISECVNLEILDASKNDICELIKLRPLTKLQYLNLSGNRIRTLDGLETLENLKSLNISGNQIDNLNEFNKLRDLAFLTQLVIDDPKAAASNPICQKIKNYKQEIMTNLPKLEYLDGQPVQIIQDTFFQHKINISSPNKSKNWAQEEYSKPWFNQEQLEIKTNTAKDEFLEEERAKFNNTYDEVKRQMAMMRERVGDIEATLRFNHSD